MSGGQLLELTLRDILQVINPLREDWSIRFYIINELQAVVQSIESLRGATVEPFGSFVSNLFTRWGDLDISIELSNGSHILSAGKKHKQMLLNDVLRVLRTKGGWRNLHFFANARIPILKLETSHSISCDISINNLSGQMKSKLLFWMNEIDGRFRDMVLLIKEWAKAHNINDPKFGSLNSYSLSLLVVFHFQTCVPAIFPPLKEIYPGNMVDDLIGVRALAEKHVEETCAVNINRYRSDSSRLTNHSSLSQLFMSFLEKFSDISAKAATQGISPYTGQWEDIDTNMRWLPKTYAVFIEDPFEQPVNTARTVSNKQLARISNSFQTTLNMVNAANQDQSMLVSALVRPQISQFLVKPPFRCQSSHSNGTRPQIPRAMQPAGRVQDQFQNRRSQKRQNETNQRPAQVVHIPKVHSQVQQVWRPRSES
nr:protein HESO1-like isoform X1 [Coffea arabica]XP_027104377.1 protein HESO1-like isoform X1 [Coffea arabica]XP_027104378.1 protein HESO1-like isoform X1 [Coffea arabica]